MKTTKKKEGFEKALSKRLSKATKYKEVAKLPPYKVNIKILGRTHVGYGRSIVEALDALQLGKVAKGMSVLEVTHGENKKSVILPPAMTFRVFSSSGIIREISMKALLLKLGGI